MTSTPGTSGTGSATDLGGALLGAQVHSGELSGAGCNPLGPATDLTGRTDIADLQRDRAGCLWKSKERVLGDRAGLGAQGPRSFPGKAFEAHATDRLCVSGGPSFADLCPRPLSAATGRTAPGAGSKTWCVGSFLRKSGAPPLPVLITGQTWSHSL